MSSSDPAVALPLSLPINASGAGLQSAQIASLTAQIEQLVRKNDSLSRQYENDKRKMETTMDLEQKRAQNTILKMKEANKQEVSSWETDCEKLRIACNFALLDAYHLNDVTKRDVRTLNIQINQLLTQLKIKDFALLRSQSIQEELKDQLDRSEEVYIRHLEEITASYEAALASATSSSTGNTKQLNQLKEQISSSQQEKEAAEAEAQSLREKADRLEEDNADKSNEIERLRLEMKDLQLELKDAQKESRDLKDQAANWKRLEGKEADGIKEAKKRVKETELQLKAVQSQVEELQATNADLKDRNAELKERNSEMKTEVKELKKDMKASTGRLDKEPSHLEDSKDGDDTATAAKSKKRARDDLNDPADAVSVGSKRPYKKVKADPGDSKPKVPKTTTAPKPVKAKPVRRPSPSPPPRSPTPLSDPSAASSDAEAKPVIKPAISKPQRPWQKNQDLNGNGSKAKSKAFSALLQDDNDGVIIGAVGKAPSVQRKELDDPKPTTIKAKKERSGNTKGESQKRVASGSQNKAKAAINLVDEEDEPETFNLNGVHGSDSEDPEEHVLKVKNKDERVKAKKVTANPKADSGKQNIEARRKADKVSSAVVTAGNDAPVKPKKRAMNLLGGVIGGAGTSALGDWWSNTNAPNTYGIPVALSSPEKSTSQNVPRARFEFGKGY